MIRQNRNGNTQTIKYGAYEILIRRKVRNDYDITYSIIVIEPAGADAYIIKKRFSGITPEKESAAIEKAKKFIDTL